MVDGGTRQRMLPHAHVSVHANAGYKGGEEMAARVLIPFSPFVYFPFSSLSSAHPLPSCVVLRRTA